MTFFKLCVLYLFWNRGSTILVITLEDYSGHYIIFGVKIKTVILFW